LSDIPETSIASLYARDPKTLSDADFKMLVADLRLKRQKFVLGEGSKPKTTAATSAVGTLAAKLDIKL
jgi:hypothetical protein